MCNDEKLLKHQLKNKRKAKYEMGKVNALTMVNLDTIVKIANKNLVS